AEVGREGRPWLGGAAGGAVGRGLGRRLGLGASRVHLLGAPRSRPCVVRSAPGPVPRWTGRPVLDDVGPTRCTRSNNVINPSRLRSCRDAAPATAELQWLAFPSSVRRDHVVPCCPRASAHEGTR